MPILEFLDAEKGAFGPDDLKAMGEAYSAAFSKLGLRDLKDPMTEIVAGRIIQATFAGERSVIKLTEIGARSED